MITRAGHKSVMLDSLEDFESLREIAQPEMRSPAHAPHCRHYGAGYKPVARPARWVCATNDSKSQDTDDSLSSSKPLERSS